MATRAKGAATVPTPKRGAAVKRRTAAPKSVAWHPVFLADLAENCNVSNAARAAGIDRRVAYDHRHADPAFAAAWDSAIEQAVEALEFEVRRRALKGVSKPVFYQGAECGAVQEYSDTLAIFLLKAHRPKIYRENQAAGTEDDPVHHRHTVEYINDWRRGSRTDG